VSHQTLNNTCHMLPKCRIESRARPGVLPVPEFVLQHRLHPSEIQVA
jgi:hypothetical protein